jgi:hypothetical protein
VALAEQSARLKQKARKLCEALTQRNIAIVENQSVWFNGKTLLSMGITTM